MELTKAIPAHTKVFHYRWCKKNFVQMSPKYRRIRSGFVDPMDACHFCGRAFVDGEWMALAALVRGPNKILCQECAGKLLQSDATGGT